MMRDEHTLYSYLSLTGACSLLFFDRQKSLVRTLMAVYWDRPFVSRKGLQEPCPVHRVYMACLIYSSLLQLMMRLLMDRRWELSWLNALIPSLQTWLTTLFLSQHFVKNRSCSYFKAGWFRNISSGD